MGMGFAPTWLRQVSPPPASQNHFNHWPQASLQIDCVCFLVGYWVVIMQKSFDLLRNTVSSHSIRSVVWRKPGIWETEVPQQGQGQSCGAEVATWDKALRSWRKKTSDVQFKKKNYEEHSVVCITLLSKHLLRNAMHNVDVVDLRAHRLMPLPASNYNVNSHYILQFLTDM